MKTLPCIVALAVLCACASPLRVYTDYDPDYDQWRYTTYSLRKHSADSFSVDGLDDAREQILRSSIVNELGKHGYAMNDQVPDFFLRYYILVDDRTVVSPELAGYFLGPLWMRTHAHNYIDKEEILVLDLLDARSNHVVWKGWTTTTYHTAANRRERTKILKKSVSMMFKDFPNAPKQRAIFGAIVNK